MPLQIEYVVERSWTTGFQATVTLTNLGPDPAPTWEVTFDFRDVTIEHLWDAAIVAETERIYTVAPRPGAAPLLPGETTTFGFTARGCSTQWPHFVTEDDQEDDLDDDPFGIYGGVAPTDATETRPTTTSAGAEIVAFPVDRIADAGTSTTDPDAETGIIRTLRPRRGDNRLNTARPALVPSDRLFLDAGTVRDLLAKVDWLYFESGAMMHANTLLGLKDRRPVARPANENTHPASGTPSHPAPARGMDPQPTAHDALGAPGSSDHVGANDAGPTVPDAGSAGASQPAAPERAPACRRQSGSRVSRRRLDEPALLPPLPPQDDWLL